MALRSAWADAWGDVSPLLHRRLASSDQHHRIALEVAGLARDVLARLSVYGPT